MGRNPQVVNGQHVVVLDGLHETEEVLKAVLEPQGCRVNRIRKPHSGDLITENELPSIVVMHDDDLPGTSTAQTGWNEIPKVVIGSVKVASQQQTDQSTRFLAQPFQYAELIDSIESLLNQPRPRA
jgi:DNA-binding NtrC family response regulator